MRDFVIITRNAAAISAAVAVYSPIMSAAQKIYWYFDFISPFAYLQHELLLRRGLAREYRPVLFGGLLKHYRHKGPAEIPSKRVITYQHCQFLAERYGVPMRFPPAHPFNPLVLLRLAVARNCDTECVTEIFRALYTDGLDLNQPDNLRQLCARLGVDENAANAPQVKTKLRANTEQATAAGVFGVPTLMIGARIFWGLDMTDMALAYLESPARFSQGEYQRLAQLPVGITRKP